MNEQRNLFLAILLSVLILVGFEYFYGAPKREALLAQQQAQTAAQTTQEAPPLPGSPESAPLAPSVAPSTTPAQSGFQAREAVLPKTARLPIHSPKLHGSIALEGARLDDLTLAEYHETPDPASGEIVLLSPSGTAGAYFARFGWTTGDKSVDLPDDKTPWQAEGERLAPGENVTLRWTGKTGLKFTRTIALDDHYMFTLTDTVENTGSGDVTLHPYGLVSRLHEQKGTSYYILHEGPLGVLDGTLKESTYEDLKEEPVKPMDSTGGWLGITDKYWLTALIPDPQEKIQARFTYLHEQDSHRYQTDFLGAARILPAGGSLSLTQHLFAGAKKVTLLDSYGDSLGIPRFDLAVDFGWFYFLTKPLFHLLNFFDRLLGNVGLSILAMTVVIRLILFPLADKSFRSMNHMKRLQPEMMRLRERFGDDRTRMNQEMMALYQREKLNPAAGCLPMLLQIPVFFSLYKVLFVTIEMRHAPFYGWVHDLSAADPTTLFNLFGLIPWTPPAFLHLGLWPILMGVTMVLQQKLNPPPPDPIQAKVFGLLPYVFTLLLANFPAGLVIYWAWNNILSIAQQWYLMKSEEKRTPASR